MLRAAALALTFVAAIGHERLVPATLAVLPIVVLVNKVAGLYERDELLLRKTTLDEVPVLFRVATLYTLVVWLLQGLVIAGSLQRPEVLALWLALFIGFVLTRSAARRIARAVAPVERCVVLGSADEQARVATKLAAEEKTRARVVARIDPCRRDQNGGNGDVASSREAIAELIAQNAVHRAIVAPGDMDPNEMVDLIGTIKGLGVRVSVLPRLFEVVGSSVEFDRVGGMTLLGVRRFGLTRSSSAIKRGFDIALSSIGLLFAFPALAIIAVAIKMDSRGPVLFRQTRIGRGGRAFAMLKFRTMVDGADEEKPALAALNEGDGLSRSPPIPA